MDSPLTYEEKRLLPNLANVLGGNKFKYKVVQIWPGLFVCKQVTVCPGHIWTTLYLHAALIFMRSLRKLCPSTRTNV